MPLAVCGTLRVLLILAVAVVASVESLTAQTVESQPAVRYTYDVGLSSVPMTRNAQIFTLAGALADRGANAALDTVLGDVNEKRGAKGVLERIARLWFVDMPIASLAVGGNHEFGHVQRVGWPSDYVMHVTQWPWPVPMSGIEVMSLTPPPNPLWNLSPVAGGIEADFVNAERALDRMYEGGGASPYEMVHFTYAKAHRTVYVFFGGEGDPANYTSTLAFMHLGSFTAPASAVEVEYGRIRDSMRKGAWLNLLDYALVANVERVLVDYVGRGDPILEPAWLEVGRLRLVPSVNYLFTSRGPQYQVGSRFRMPGGVGNAYVRWTEDLRVDYVSWEDYERFTPQVPFRVRLFGAGVQFRSTSRRTIAPTVSFDGWRDVDGRTGGRVELGGVFHTSALGPRNAIRFAIGGKTSGYLPGFPDSSGMYVDGGLVISF